MQRPSVSGLGPERGTGSVRWRPPFCRCWRHAWRSARSSYRQIGVALDLLRRNPQGVTVVEAGPDDFDQEWMTLILGVKVVDDVEEAIEHIYAHGSEHSEGILTHNLAHANRFVEAINTSAVLSTPSTRFNDGGRFGLGAEVAVSTQKLHAAGRSGSGGADDLQVGVHRQLGHQAMSDFLYVNGAFVPASQAALALNDLGLVRGYGVFEVLRAYGRSFRSVRAHLDRLAYSAEQIELALPWSLDNLAAIVMETLARNTATDATVRMVVTGGP